MQSTRSLGFWAARTRYWLIFNLLCTRNPRSFLASLLTDYAVIGLFRPRYRANLPLLNFVRFLSDQFSTCFSRLTLQHIGCSLQHDLSFFKDKALCLWVTPLHRLQCHILTFPSSHSWRACFHPCSTPSMQAMPPHPSNFNEIITLQLCTDFSFFLVFLSHGTYNHCRSAWDEPSVTWLSKEKGSMRTSLILLSPGLFLTGPALLL